MAFHIVHPESHQTSWVPVYAADTCYIGQIVCVDIAAPLAGVMPWTCAAGTNGSTHKDQPMGIVIGMNATAANMAYSSTYKCQSITAAADAAIFGATTQYRGVEGPWSRGDPVAMVKIHHIDTNTIIRGDMFDTTYGVAPAELTVTTGCGGDGLDCTTGDTDVATVGGFATIYFRTGENAGIYRQLSTTHINTHEWEKATKGTTNIGDKCVIAPVNAFGPSRMQIDAEAMFIATESDLTTNFYVIHVRRLDLSVPGGEYVEFRIDADNFCMNRA